MRTTITLSDTLYRALKLRAIDAGETVSSLIEEAVKHQLLEDLEDIQAARDRENEPAIDFDTFVKELKNDGLL